MAPRNPERVRAELARLAHRRLERTAFWREAAAILGRAVQFDGGCWHTADPASRLITSHYTNLSGEGFPFIVANEYREADVNKFADLAGRKQPAATLSDATGGRPARSARFRTIYGPRGWGSELRASFDLAGTTWGSVMLLRERGRPEFTPEEARLVADLAPQIAHGVRQTMLSGGGPATHDLAPGVVVVGADGAPDSVTPQAERWLAELVDEPRVGALPSSVLSVAARARRPEEAGPAYARVHAASGAWFSLHASTFEDAAAPRVAVVVAPAQPIEIAPLIVAAYGLTARERQVLQLVTRGLSTAEIAAALWVTPYTVQDHLKAIFEKTGARDRRDLVARLFFEHFMPNVSADTPLGANGWFA
jgi:DNA-binding CsgD family transcriptional regulator